MRRRKSTTKFNKTLRTLAEDFLYDHSFYANAGVKPSEVLRAYSCRLESSGYTWDDGWNPVEYDLIQERMGGSEVRRKGRYVTWTVVSEAFHMWLAGLFKDMGKEKSNG